MQPPTDRTIDGKSLLPLLEAGQGQRHHEYVYHAWDRYFPNPDTRWAISDQRWKLCCQARQGEQPSEKIWQLYDLESDPGETTNLAPEHPAIVRRLRAEFLRWFDDVTEGVEYQPVPIPIGHPDEPLIEIQPSWAKWHGDNIEYVFRGYDWDTIEGWKEAGEQATWNLDMLHGGQYELAISYGRSARGGGTLKISVGDESLSCCPPPTPTADVFERLHVGTLMLSEGPAILNAEVVEAHGPELMRLNRIFLRRIDEAGKP
ncbi:MAG: sulfatase/phosphatase domain-containing protein [Pirellulaceae bacterium]